MVRGAWRERGGKKIGRSAEQLERHDNVDGVCGAACAYLQQLIAVRSQLCLFGFFLLDKARIFKHAL